MLAISRWRLIEATGANSYTPFGLQSVQGFAKDWSRNTFIFLNLVHKPNNIFISNFQLKSMILRARNIVLEVILLPNF